MCNQKHGEKEGKKNNCVITSSFVHNGEEKELIMGKKPSFVWRHTNYFFLIRITSNIV